MISRRAILSQYLMRCLQNFSLEENLIQFHNYMKQYMIFCTMSFYILDSKSNAYSPWIVIENGEIVRFDYNSKMLIKIADFPNYPTDYIYIENNIQSSPYLIPLHARDESSLIAFTILKKGDLSVAINFKSKQKDQFNSEHIEILNLIRPLLQIVVESNFLNNSTVTSFSTKAVFQNSYELIKECRGLKQVVQQVESIAKSHIPVLILGESGVGKELIADSVHYLSDKNAQDIIKVNCAALSENLVDSELFGHEKGSFTGASSSHTGYFEQASSGTLFLDEIGDLSISTQSKILRVLQNGEFRKVGSTRISLCKARLIFATNKDLAKLVKENKFRADLLYRLTVFPIYVPPLSKRKEDIPVLIRILYTRKVEELQLNSPPQLTEDFINYCYTQKWEGNIRELEHFITRSIVLNFHAGRKYLQVTEKNSIQSFEAKSLKNVKKEYIVEALRLCQGRIQGPQGAAAYLKINSNTLRSQMKKLGIPILLSERKKLYANG